MPKRYWLISLAILVLVSAFSIFIFAQKTSAPEPECYVDSALEKLEITQASNIFYAEVASTQAQQQHGLSGRNCITGNHAMLFPYDTPGEYCFWMKDMNFPIDIVWLDPNKRIINYVSNVNPDTYPRNYCPDEPAKYVLEFREGIVNRFNWSPGLEFTW